MVETGAKRVSRFQVPKRRACTQPQIYLKEDHNMIKITIKTDNDAFHEGFSENHNGREVARILRVLADRFDVGNASSKGLQDYNGNTVGQVEPTGKDRGLA